MLSREVAPLGIKVTIVEPGGKSATEAIVTEGTEKGEVHRVCANPDCPFHRPKKQPKGREEHPGLRPA